MRPEKANIVKDLKDQLNASPFLLVADYTGLKVDQFAELRTRLVAVGAECHVVKNTMLRIAATELGLPDMADSLTGQTAIVTGEQDICSTAKVIKTFAAEFKKPSVKVGILDNALLTAAQVEAMADLPPLPVLQSQLLGLLNMPASQLVRTLNEPAASLARVLKAKVDTAGGAA
ncbi:MAG: 50S ribosomal protein L10 [Chthoniobacterales bacterium]